MTRVAFTLTMAFNAFFAASSLAGQAPGLASAPDVPISHRDRVYAAEQFSNTVSVTDPASNTLLGVIRLGEPQPGNLSPLYRGQVLVHGMGFSPDHKTLVVVSIGTNAVSFIDTATNAVKHTTYVGRAPHEAFFTPDGGEVWVTVRGEDYVVVLDAHTFAEKGRINVPAGPGMTIFFAGWHVWLRLFVLQPRNRCRYRRRPSNRGQSPASKPVLSEPGGDAGRGTGLADPQGCRQGRSVRCAAAVFGVEDPGYRSDHQPCQHRAQRPGQLRLCHCRRFERGESVPHRHVRTSCDDSCRQPAARHLALRRRNTGSM